MKRLLNLFIFCIPLFFTACKQTVSYGTEYKKTKPVKSVQWLELTKQHTDISQLTDEDSRVFIVQVNLTNENLDKEDINSTLHCRTDYLGNPLPELVNPRPAKSSAFRSASDDEKPAKEKDFYLYINDIPASNPRHFTLMSESNHAYIYYCPNIKYLSDGGRNFFTDDEFKKIGDQFDAFYEASVNISGTPEIRIEADNIIKTSKKIFICLCDLDEDAKSLNEAGSLGGYFTGGDYYKKQNHYFSNECQAIYIDAVSVKREGTQGGIYLGAIPHEFNHLLNNSNKCFNPKNPYGSYASWFTEGLAVLIPDLLSEYYTYKNPSADVGPWRFSQYNNLYNKGFRTWDTENYITYSLAYSYFSFLIRNYGGVPFIHEIQTNDYSNEEAITKALENNKIPSPFRNGEYANFQDTVLDYALSAVNFEIAGNSSLHTFNKSVAETYNGFHYSSKAIDLNKYEQHDAGYKSNGEYGLRMIPVGETEELGDLGSIVQYAGTGTKEINVTLPEWEGIKMYCVIQHF